MLRNSLPMNATSCAPFNSIQPQPSQSGGLLSTRPSRCGSHYQRARQAGQPDNTAAGAVMHPIVEISPSDSVRRRRLMGHEMAAEFVQSTNDDRTEYRFRASLHLLAAYEQGVRRDGETLVQGLPGSTRRDLAQKLTFVPAGHDYREWHQPRTRTRLMYFYFDPAELQSQCGISEMALSPRLFFDDTSVWQTVLKLKRLAGRPDLGQLALF